MPHAAEEQSNRRQDRDLGSKRFSRGDADLRAGMHVDATIALACNRAGDIVANAKSAIAFPPAFAKSAERVRGLAALADGEHDRVARHRGIAMAEFAGELHLGRNLGELLD